MEDYRTYLAASILTEDKVVTYRLLSRVLKVHVNTAKEMLYEFHRQQNLKKPGTIHATYLLSGTKREDPEPTNVTKKDGEDEYMQSSPFMGSSVQQAGENTGESGVLTISLVKEEDLQQLEAEYDTISSIHVYSLGPNPLKDLQLLSDTTRELATLTAAEDPVAFASKYGTILNPLVKRRPSRHLPPAALPTKPASQAAKPKPAEIVKEKEVPKAKQDQKSTQSAAAKEFFGKGKEKIKPTAGSAPSSKEGTPAPAPPATLKKESSSIFKSFAKAKPKLKREGTDSSAAEDVSMNNVHFDDDDDEEDDYVAPIPPKKEKMDNGESDGDRKSRKAREADLKRMMDEEDDEEEAVSTPEPEEEEEETILEKEKTAKEEDPVVTVSGGRRRGKRRVMRKKTVKDEEGYLVTKEEAAWESFSEEEPVAPKPKSHIPSTTAKGKKGGPKAGQGNIMSFFGKK